ncbi:MAG: hypothetical protein AB7V77_04410 [Candidatus Woesearchaeota archaeon]
MKNENNSNLWIISIIAIVAIVGMTFMFSENKVSYASEEANYVYEDAEGDLAGQAVKAVATKLPRETIPTPIDPLEETNVYINYYFSRYQSMWDDNYIAVNANVNYDKQVIGETSTYAYSNCQINAGDGYASFSTSPNIYDEVLSNAQFNSHLYGHTSGNGDYLYINCNLNDKPTLGDSISLDIDDFGYFKDVALVPYGEEYLLYIHAISPNKGFTLTYGYSYMDDYMWGEIDSGTAAEYIGLIPVTMTGTEQVSFHVASYIDNYVEDDGIYRSVGKSTYTYVWYDPYESKSVSTKEVVVDGKTYNAIPLNSKTTITEQELKEISERIMES